MRLACAAVLAVTMLVAACGSDEAADDSPPLVGTPPALVSVDEAVETEAGEAVRVQGGLIADGDDVRLCSGFAESHPPQCARPFLRVEGLNLSTIEGLESAAGIRWKEGVTLTGTVRDGILSVEG